MATEFSVITPSDRFFLAPVTAESSLQEFSSLSIPQTH